MNIKDIDFNNMDEKTKAMIKVGAILMGVTIFLLVFMLIYKSMAGNKLSFDKIENLMIRATKNYVQAHPEKIDEGIYGTIEIKISDLVAEGYMKEMTKYTDKETLCTGSVLVFKNLDNITYSPKLDCGEAYKYTNLVDEITKSENIVSTDAGLYKIESEDPYYIYRGENVYNYIKFGEKTWRILRIDSNNNIRLIEADSDADVEWDDRYNVDVAEKVGINEFEYSEPSRIKQHLIDAYNNEKLFTTDMKSIVIPTELCIGKRALTELDNTGNIECSKKSEMLGLGTIYLSEYFEASLDQNCFGYNSQSCKNYNYLANYKRRYWTLTASNQDSHKVYIIYGNPKLVSADYTSFINLTVTINGNINYKSGDGSQENPYVVDLIA